MTHPIGTGTCNLTYNAPLDERDVISRAAFRKGLSIGSYMKRLMLLGMAVDDPIRADELREVRKRYYGATLLTIFVLALLCGQSLEIRRVRTRVREEVMEETSS